MATTTDHWNGRRGGVERLAVWGGGAALMVLPVFAVRSVEELTSDPGDFMFLAMLLAGMGVTYELSARASARSAYPAAIIIALAAGLLSSWINLAVGIIGTEDNPANWIYGGVLAVAAVGAVIARFRPLGMARAMVATAVAQALAFVVALVADLGFTGPVTVFLAGLWLISAGLFRKAAGTQGGVGTRTGA